MCERELETNVTQFICMDAVEHLSFCKALLSNSCVHVAFPRKASVCSVVTTTTMKIPFRLANPTMGRSTVVLFTFCPNRLLSAALVFFGIYSYCIEWQGRSSCTEWQRRLILHIGCGLNTSGKEGFIVLHC